MTHNFIMFTKLAPRLALILSCAIPLASCLTDLDRNYNNLPTLGKTQDDLKLFNRRLDALLRVVQSNETADLKSIRGRARRLVWESVWMSEREIYEMLVDLAVPEICDQEKAKLWLLVHGLIQEVGPDDRSRLQPVVDYLEHYGGLKYEYCARKAEEQFVQFDFADSKRKSALADFDRFIKYVAGVRDSQAQDANQLYKLIASFKVIGAIRSRDTRRRLRRYLLKGATGGLDKAVRDHLSSECFRLEKQFGKNFAIINLGQALSGYRIDDQRLKKVNEYYRIFCVTKLASEAPKTGRGHPAKKNRICDKIGGVMGLLCAPSG